MAKIIGRNANTTGTATIDTGITLNTSTSVKVGDSNDDRIHFEISNDGPGKVFLKLQAASVDDIKKGIIIQSGQTWWMPTDNIYTGEISAIANTGSPVVYPTEY